MPPIHSPLEQLDTSDLEKLRSLAKARGIKKRDRDSSPITKIPRDGGLPLSFAQQRLWFLAQLEPDSATYNISFALRLRGDLNGPALRRSLDALFARHESLRSIFVTADGQPHVELLPEEKGLSLVEEDLRGLDDRLERVKQLSREEALRAFDLSRGPLVRTRLIRLEDQEYVFLLTQHHIVSDEWSMGIFVREIGELYEAFSRGQTNPLAPLSIQYPDYAGWQRQWLSGERLQKQTEYWRQTLADAPVSLDLPTDRLRPPRQSFAGSSVPIQIDRELARELRGLSSQYDVTLFMTLLSAWAAVLSRLSGQEDLVIGVPTANRGRPETEGVIGFFLNTLALRVELRNKPSCAELLGRVRATVLAAQDHQDLPFEQVVEIVQPPRRLNHTPLFQVMLLWETNQQSFLELPRVAVQPVGISNGAVRFDLEMAFHEQGDTLVGSLNYATALFEEETIQRQRGYLLTMLKAMVANSEQKLADIELLASEERMLLLETWNATETAYPEHQCIHQLFEQQAEKSPQATAVVFEEQSLTYAELNAEVNRVAHYLIALGVKPDDRVAICVERGTGMAIGLLGILKAGGAYVPLDPAYPPQRLREILADADPKLLLSDAAGRAALGAAVLAEKLVVDLNQTPPAWTGMPHSNPDVKTLNLTSQHPAYVIYTSGSTGKPKGVIATHDCVVNFLISMSATPGITAQDRLLAVTSISFDIAGLELYLPLSRGAGIVIASREDSVDPKAMQSLLTRHKISVMQATPATWRALLDANWKKVPELKILCGGEALARDLSLRLVDQGESLWNLYGPTETTIWSCCVKVAGREKGANANESIGRPIANTRIYLLDAGGQPVPLGAAGEIYIGGAGVARGYLNRPELTAERFVPEAFSSVPGARMYRTGDLGRYLPDGTIEFLGRNDYQVKIRGFRIELGEIEARLAEHPGVREAVVVAREDVPGEQRLVGYVVPQPADECATTTSIPAKTTFSLFYFGADTSAKQNKYELYLQSAKFADANQFEAIWTPERHFHNVGKLYPNPATLSAALSTMTTNVKLRAGSVVLPLHDPIRVAEEWSIIDNLSNGRAGIAAASGWHPRDFSLFPQNYTHRKQVMVESIQQLKSLWRGEAITRTDGNGKEGPVRIFPEPIQAELPLWITAAASPDTFILAGKLGANLLTHLLGQTIPELATQIAQYRAARAEAGHDPQTGRVTLMIHTFLGEELGETLSQAKAPFMDYMREHLGLMASWAKSLDLNVDDILRGDEKEKVVEFAFERYSRTASLIGTPQSCLSIANQLQEIGVDEIACLIDWMDTEKALNGLSQLKRLYDLSRASLNRATLRSYLSSQLPDYMIPAAFVILDVLPHTPNGKLDRKALPLPDDNAFNRHVYEPPLGDTEKLLAHLWEELLGVERVGRHDNFFELGGHSLLAVQLIERLRRLDLYLEIRSLFATPVLRELAADIGHHSETAIPPNVIQSDTQVITPEMLPLIDLTQEDIDHIVERTPGGIANIEDIYALSALQEGVLFHYLMAREGDPYLMIDQLIFPDRTQLDRFLSVAQQVIDRHDILRTAFVWEGLSKPAQVVWRHAQLSVTEMEMDPRNGPIVEQLAYHFDPWRQRIDLTQAPLLRFTIIRDLERDRWILSQQGHQLIGDHSTTDVLRDEISLLLTDQGHRMSPALPFRNRVALARLGESSEEHERFFRRMLGEVTEPTLPFGLTDIHQSGRDVVESRWMLPQVLSDRLRAHARRLGVSLASLCHLAWGQVLARSSGQKRVVFGTVLFGRMQAGEGADQAAGLFVNTLPLRLDMDDTGTENAVRQTHARLAELLMYEHASLPLAQRCSGVAAPSPLFSVMLNYRYQRMPTAIEGNVNSKHPLRGIEFLRNVERTNYPLTLNVEDYGQALGLTALVVRQVSAERVCVYMQQALESLALVLDTAPHTPVQELEVLPAQERRLLLDTWNATEAEYPRHLCMHQLFEEQAKKRPEATALVFEDQSLSYGELNRHANRLAHYLIGMGVKPDERIGICAERSFGMVIGLLGILKAGGAYVPLDPGYPAERLEQILVDAAPRFTLSDDAGRKALGMELLAGLTVVDLDQLGEEGKQSSEWGKQPDSNPDPQFLGLNSRNLAYVIYTSGSTGTPKGAMNEHHALINRLLWMQRAYGLDPTDVVLQKTSFSFDVSVWEFFWTLSQGAILAIAPPDTHKDSVQLIKLIQKHAVTTMHFVPSMLAIFLNSEGVEGCTSLRRLVCSGEALAAAQVQIYQSKVPGSELHNLYGPTEAAIDVTAWSCPGNYAGMIVPIGRPIANTQIYVLDSQGQPVPLGAVGEIYIGGDGVARGYLRRPDLTAERFVPNPFHAGAGERMYRTGDLGRYLQDGNIEFLGRNDQQVKIRGFRIELGEIEARLLEHELVRESVVVAQEDAGGGKRLIAYIVSALAEEKSDRSDSDPVQLAGTLRAYVSVCLPEYMVPAAFVVLENLPLTPNGKLDRKALPAPEGEAYALRQYEPVRGEMENVLANLWQELLGVERVGRHDHFFELGGHSLLAVQLVQRLRRLDLQIEVRALFAAPVLSELAATLSHYREISIPPVLIKPDSAVITPEMLPLIDLTQPNIDQIVERVPGGIANIQDIYALSPLQEGILFHHLMGGEGDPYLLAVQLSFESRARLDSYVEAMQAVVDRHDILRTAVEWEGLREPVQVVWRKAILQVDEVELDSAAGDVAAQLYARFNPRQYRIDVRKAPLLRIHIAEDGGKDRWLMVVLLHHLAGDHVTLEVMQEEIEAYLLGRAQQLPVPLPFRNLVAQARLGVNSEEHEDFFRKLLGDVTEPTAPFGLLDVQGDGTGIEEARVALDKDLAQRVRERARKLRVSAASLFHLAWAQVLARVSRREDVVFGTVLFGRMQGGMGADRVMGLFINTLPVRIQIDDERVETSVQRVHSQLSDLLRHEHASLGLAQRCSGVAAPTPLFSSLFNYRHTGVRGQEAMAKRKHAFEGIGMLYGEERTNYPFGFWVDDMGEGFVLTAQTVASIDPKRVCEYMHTALKSLVQALETAPGRAINSLEILPEKERKQLLYEWNATEVEYSREKCTLALFEEQVQKTPEAVALVDEGAKLTYAELNRRANQLARCFQDAYGLCAGDLAAIQMERSSQMVECILAIWKCGAAYVPVEPDYPNERNRSILAETRPRLVVTQEELNKIKPALHNYQGLNLDQPVRPEDLAYVIFTSGSTGKPKGVMIEHAGMLNHLLAKIDDLKITAGSVIAQNASHCFDISVWQMFAALLVGGQTIIYGNNLILDPEKLLDRVKSDGVTVLEVVPSYLAALLLRLEGQRGACARLQYLVVTGEVVQPSLVDMWFNIFPEIPVVNAYGPTEASDDITHHFMHAYSAVPSIPVGKPIRNTHIYVVDGNEKLCPIGVTGEIWVSGVGIGRGYLNDAEKTSLAFGADPFRPEASVRLYRTGDLGNFSVEGNLLLAGRKDDQVKIRGFRIELGEIEARLSAHPQVREAVVVAREDGGGGKRLVAYAVMAGATVEEESVRHNLEDEDREMEAGELSAMLRTHLAGQLPEYMVPATYVRLDRMPLTPNGKLDRKALPAPEREDARGYEEPQGETESKLTKIWERVLETSQVGRHDNFFELGGHSLLVMQLMVEVQRSFGINISLRDVFMSPTVAELASALKRGDLAQRHQNLIPVRLAGTRTPLFVIHALGGGVDYVTDLAPFIHEDIPVYGLQATGFAPGEEPLQTIGEMAELYVDNIRQIQPHGPYRLAGWSAGGTIAYEMARRLIEMGEQVEFVGLLDTIYEETTTSFENGRTKDFDANFELIQVLSMILDKEDLNEVIQMAKIYEFETLIEHGGHILEKIAKQYPSVDTLDVAALRRLLMILHATSNALSSYSFVRLSMPVWLFEASEAVKPSGPAWRRLLGDDIQVVPVQGTHHTLTAGLENLSSLGTAISVALAENSSQTISSPALHPFTSSVT